MANSAAVCTSFKVELLNGHHALGTSVTRAGTTADTIKAALYLASATINASTTAYSATGEVSGTNYTAGGVTVTNGTAPTSSGTTAYWTPSASLSWSNVTLSTSFDCVLFYNATQSNKAIAAYTFGAQVVSAGNFTLSMPTNDSTNALLRLS
ncbi:MAG TPA: hypothetical protein VFS24_17355 [Steroidobacteraceae bacterium]|nr:hypothetical protein [Steroidobacteraceae bacterium]